jgi:hypothetical protein
VLSSCTLLQPSRYLPEAGVAPAPLRADTTLAWGSPDGAPCLPDVPRAIGKLGPRGAMLGFRLGGAASVGGYRRHWQGVQRAGFGTARDLFVSRSGGRPAALIVRLDSRPDDGGRLSLDSTARMPPPDDRVVGRIPPDSGYDHAGGMSLTGTVLAVPMDGGNRSQVVFYDVSIPEAPRRLAVLDHSTAREPSSPDNASAVGIVRLQDQRYLLVLGVHSSKLVEFYRSRGTSLHDPDLSFELLGVLQGLDVGGFQNLALLAQCDGALFLAGTHNTAVPPPSKGRDHAHWYRLRDGSGAMPRLEKGGERWLRCEHCNLAAGAGFFITPQRALLLYATEFWARKSGDWVVMEEFGPPLGHPGSERPAEPGGHGMTGRGPASAIAPSALE